MAQTPKRSPHRPRVADDREKYSPTLTDSRSRRPEPDYDQPPGAIEPEEEFDDEFLDEFDESDDAPVR